MKEEKVERWIKAGYKLLGSEGHEGIKIERLAHMLCLNKSGFYYYFGSMKNYSKCLLQHHVNLAKDIGEEIKKCKVVDPDLLHLIVRHKLFFQVESQLQLKGKALSSQENFDVASKIISKQFLPLWTKAIQLPEDSPVALDYLDIHRQFFYARINSENINYQFLRQLVSETTNVFKRVVEEKQVFSQKTKRVSK